MKKGAQNDGRAFKIEENMGEEDLKQPFSLLGRKLNGYAGEGKGGGRWYGYAA